MCGRFRARQGPFTGGRSPTRRRGRRALRLSSHGMFLLPFVAQQASPSPSQPDCAFARKQFFAHIDLFVEATMPGGDDLWNTSSFWAHDVVNQRSRLEQIDVQRSLSSGSLFSRGSTTRVTADSITHTVTSEGKCTIASASAAEVANAACTGSVIRFLPLKLTTSYQGKHWLAKDVDAYLNTSYIDLRWARIPAAGTSAAASCGPAAGKSACELVDVFGWDYSSSGFQSSHRVYVSKVHGMPVLETQNVNSDGYPAAVTIRYTIDINSRGSVGPLFSPIANTFDVPVRCSAP